MPQCIYCFVGERKTLVQTVEAINLAGNLIRRRGFVHLCRAWLTVPSPRWSTVQGISTIEPTWAVMLVKLAVVKIVSDSTSALPFNWFELLLLGAAGAALNPLLLLLLLFVAPFTTLKLLEPLLKSLMALGTVKFRPSVGLSRSNTFVWFCSTFFGIIKKPFRTPAGTAKSNGLGWAATWWMTEKRREVKKRKRFFRVIDERKAMGQRLYHFLHSNALSARPPADIGWAGGVDWIRQP